PSHSASDELKYHGTMRLRVCRTRSNLPVSMMLPPAIAGIFLACAAGNDFVEQRLLVSLSPQKPAQTLHVFPKAAAPGRNVADVRRRHIQAFIQHLAGH